MNAPANIATGLYADRLPAREPSLADLADLAVLSALNLAIVPDLHWNAANDRAITDRELFRDRFFKVTGLTKDQLKHALDAGLLI